MRIRLLDTAAARPRARFGVTHLAWGGGLLPDESAARAAPLGSEVGRGGMESDL